MMRPNKDDKGQARAYALRLIKFRLRSEHELRDKLARKAYPGSVIDETLVFLKRSGLLDDEAFARAWVEGRIRRPLGRVRLRRELQAKGIDSRWIEAALENACRNYDEKEVIRGLIHRKMERMKDLEKEKIRARLFGYLVRRGYPQNLVVETILEETAGSLD
ncbi:MAG: regulatory protein RecX [Candidatus Omnitrophica bacterium]|nr:regulatory protein RecX [Candidatus Omnitrophota bacterium]MDD5573930.1 regulatory protein RecX [Candidatus Omnitrophota bacterium]